VALTTAGGGWAGDITAAISVMGAAMSESGQNLTAGMGVLPAVYEALGESLQRAAETLEDKPVHPDFIDDLRLLAQATLAQRELAEWANSVHKAAHGFWINGG
jgi:hypothetical protein